MWSIDHFWRPRFASATQLGSSSKTGWSSNASPPEAFVEPSLSWLAGDPQTAKLFIIAAPGAVGKSSYAKALAAATNSAIVDLAKTSAVGDNFFTGGLAKAFGSQAILDAANGKIGLIVDALDEAQMRDGPQGCEAGLLDLASIAVAASALPAVILGRAIAASDAYSMLIAKGHEACLLKIDFFTEDQASTYLLKKLPFLAARSQKVLSAFQDHGDIFRSLAKETRTILMSATGHEETNFAGYAPVLDAICEFTLDPKELNPQAKLAKLRATSQIELINDITISILEREQSKLRGQFQEQHPDTPPKTIDVLYTIEEQIQRIAFMLFGGTQPPYPELPENYYVTYQEMVERFAPQHPFVSTGKASNPVFAAYVVAWSLRKSPQANLVRQAVFSQPAFMSGIFFELYEHQMQSAEVGPQDQSTKNSKIPLEDVGLLYQALNSQIIPGQRVQLEIYDQETDDGSSVIEINFEVLERIDPNTNEAKQGRTWGPYITTPDTILKLRSPFSNVYVDAPITVELGDGITQQIGAPTEFSIEALLISANQILIHSNAADGQKELQTVALFATEAAHDNIQNVIVHEAELSVAWPGAKAHPWTRYVVETPAPANEQIAFMRRRLRKILTAFRSHSKGALVRLAAKINHSRMIKDSRGNALINKLIDDKILGLFDSGKFYRLDPDTMGRILFVGYHDLAQAKFTPEVDSYLLNVLAGIKK